jgi:hypothetical protein
MFQNPINDAVDLDVKSSDLIHFKVICPPCSQRDTEIMMLKNELLSSTSRFRVKGLEKRSFQILYWPSAIGANDTGEIQLQSPKLGTTVYSVSGSGHPPGRMPETRIVAPVGTSRSATVTFFNPMLEPVSVSLRLNSKTSALKLHALQGRSSGRMLSAPSSSQNAFFVQGKEKMEIPVSFSPADMQAHCAELFVENTRMAWIFPLRGISETTLANPKIHLISRAGAKASVEVEVPLRGFLDLKLSDAETLESLVEYSVTFLEGDPVDILVPNTLRADQTPTVSTMGISLLRTVRHPIPHGGLVKSVSWAPMTCRFRMEFVPTSALNAYLNLVIKNPQTFAQWKLILRLTGQSSEKNLRSRRPPSKSLRRAGVM